MQSQIIHIPSVGADGVIVELDKTDPRPLAACRAALKQLREKLSEHEDGDPIEIPCH